MQQVTIEREGFNPFISIYFIQGFNQEYEKLLQDILDNNGTAQRRRYQKENIERHIHEENQNMIVQIMNLIKELNKIKKLNKQVEQ